MEDICNSYTKEEIALIENEMTTYLAQRDEKYECSTSSYCWESGTIWRNDPMGPLWKEHKGMSCVLFHRMLDLGVLYSKDDKTQRFNRSMFDLENIIDSIKISLSSLGCRQNMAFPTSEPELWTSHGLGRFLCDA